MEEELVFLLVPETKWGNYIIQPARVKDEGAFYSYLGLFTDEQEVSAKTKHIIQECHKYEVSNLYNIYGRKKFKTERDFISNVDADILKLIKVFVDKTVARIIREIADNNLPLYFRESRLDNPHKKDQITIDNEPLKALLGFYRNEEHIKYILTLSSRKQEFIPAESNLRIITNQPGIVLIDNKLFYLPDGVNGTRLKPFLTKKEIIIPRQNEQEYFRKFILKNISNEDIVAEGFEVIERDSKKTAILSLERDITSCPVVELRFRYNNRSVPSYSKAPAIVELEEDGEQYRFYKTNRDFFWEQSCIDLLLGNGLSMTSSGCFKLKENNDWYFMIEWMRKHHEQLSAMNFEIRQDRLSNKYYTGHWKLEYAQESSTDWFQLHANIILDNGKTIPLQNLWQNILSGKREYTLQDGSIFIIPEEWFAHYSAIMLFGERQENRVVLKRNQFTLLDQMQTNLSPFPQQTERVELPVKLKATLRDYQLRGYHWMHNLYKQKMGACLADDMGLGKTIQTITLLLKYKEDTYKKSDTAKDINQPVQLDLFSAPVEEKTHSDDSKEPFHTCLIIAPASVVHNWRNELQKFAPSLTIAEYTGNSRSGLKQTIKSWDVIITTYQTLRNDIDFLKQHTYGIVVFDESQSFKNRESQVHQAVSLIQGRQYVALSGTPIENSLSDLWSLMYVINRGLLGNHATFQNYFIRPITNNIEGLHSDSLRRLINPFILRRTKEEVLEDLPERTDEFIFCETDPEQEKMYQEELSKARNLILERKLLQDKGQNDAFGSLQAIGRLRQIANHPRMVDAGYTSGSGKFREVFRMLEDIRGTGHKVLLFSSYVKHLDLIAEEIKKREWEYAMLTGETKNREEVINQFSNRTECQFFLISLKAGGVGLNLTEADYVFILDPWWNLATEEQAISRSHRMGQKQAVFVYRFITTGTLEEKILRIQQEKQHISDAFIIPAGKDFQPNTDQLNKLILEE